MVTLHQHYLYRGYLQIAALDLTRSTAPTLWLLHWDPTQPVATRPLSLRKNGTWYTYGHDLTKNATELYTTAGAIVTEYDYTPYGAVTATGLEQPIQWSSEYYDSELALVYYNYRHYNPLDGRWINRDPIMEQGGYNLYGFVENAVYAFLDILGLQYAATKKKDMTQIEPKKKCTFQIVAGHVDKVSDASEAFANRKNEKIVTRCDRFYGIACFLTPNGGYLWPTQVSKEFHSVPGIYKTGERKGRDRPVSSPDDSTLSDEMVSKITLAESEAVEECKKAETCCSSIHIHVKCLSDESMSAAQRKERIVDLGCRYRNTYTCEIGGKPAKWSGRLFSERIK